MLVNDGWVNEGIEFHAHTGPIAASKPVYRLYLDPTTRFWTISQAEINLLVSDGWVNEGVVFYAQ